MQRIHRACTEGKQAYWVCTLVEESETLQCQAAEITAESLRQQLPDIHVGLIHGRLKADEKSTIMQSFKAGEIQLLIATTVIEVGVDVPNASLMIIENAERLGLSQLHQLRGRVGRGEQASHCVLMFKSPLSENSKERLAIMRKTNSGFEIARKDLQLRGPGEVRQRSSQTGILEEAGRCPASADIAPIVVAIKADSRHQRCGTQASMHLPLAPVHCVLFGYIQDVLFQVMLHQTAHHQNNVILFLWQASLVAVC